MNLITISSRRIGAQEVKTVNARDLHAFLEIGKDFTNWVKDQIQRARLIESRDYVVFAQQGESGGKPRSEYHLTIDAGKHIAMMSQTEKGFEVRDYFIECERRALTAITPALPRSFAEALRLAADELEARQRAEAALSVAAPKAAALDLISAGNDTLTITEAAKVLGMKRTALVAKMQADGWIYRQNQSWVAYTQHIKSGRLKQLLYRMAKVPPAEVDAAYAQVLGVRQLNCLLGKAPAGVADAAKSLWTPGTRCVWVTGGTNQHNQAGMLYIIYLITYRTRANTL